MNRQSKLFSSPFLARSCLLTSLLSSSLVAKVAGSTSFSYFEHSSCNAGTAFYQYSDPNTLVSDINCHQMPNGTVAMYIDDVDEGCTLRAYTSSTCSASHLAGLLLTAGTCFYVDESIQLGSWRADCSAVDYSSTDGDDQGNSYTSDSGGSEGIAEILATATGPVTINTQTESEVQITKTVVPVRSTDANGSVVSTTRTTGGNVAAVETSGAASGSTTVSGTRTGTAGSSGNSATRSAGAVSSTSSTTTNTASGAIAFKPLLVSIGLAAVAFLAH